jgi:hypothetical protein
MEKACYAGVIAENVASIPVDTVMSAAIGMFQTGQRLFQGNNAVTRNQDKAET